MPPVAMGYIRACWSLSWCQSFDLGPYAWTWSGWWRYGSLSSETESPASGSGEVEFLPRGRARHSANPRLGRGRAQTRGSGEVEPALRGRARRSPWPWCRARQSLPLEVGRGGANRQGSGEAEPATLVSGEAEPTLRGRARRSVRTWGSVEAVVALLTARTNQC